MEKNEKKCIGTDAFGRELPEIPPAELEKQIRNILNYKPKPKEKPRLEDSVDAPRPVIGPVAPSKIDYKELSKSFIPIYGLYHLFLCNNCGNEKLKFNYHSSALPFFLVGPSIVQGFTLSALIELIK